MRRTLAGIVVLVAGLGCTRPAMLKPPRPVPAGSVLLQFTRPVKDSIELVLDGTRVPVDTSAAARKRLFRKDQGGTNLWITGLKPGKHHYFLSSPTLAFGPDQGDFMVNTGEGTYLVLFSQTFKAVLYGTPEPLPAPEGLAGVKAVLEK